MASVHMTVTLVRDRKRFWINTPNGRVTLKDWCDRHAPGAYNSIHARVKHLAAGENYSALPDAIQAITATRKRRAVQAAARAARGTVELSPLARRLAEAELRHAATLADILGYTITITKRGEHERSAQESSSSDGDGPDGLRLPERHSADPGTH